MSKAKIKIVYMGTPDFAVLPLQSLLNDDSFEISAVITQPDQKVGRKQLLTPSPLKIFALQQGLTVLQPEEINKNNQILTLLKSLKPDFMIVVAFGQILNNDLLGIAKYGAINIHGSLLPKYRGASPVEEALLNGDNVTGVTFIKMSERLDAGPILLIQRLTIAPQDNVLTLRKKLSLMAATQLPYLLKDIIEGVIQPIEQNNNNATFCRKIKKGNGIIDLNKMSAIQIHNMVRAYTPWPSAYLIADNKRLKILETELTDLQAKNLQPGQTIQLPDQKFALVTKEGALMINKVQLEGKNPTPIQDFLRGNKDFFKKILANPK